MSLSIDPGFSKASPLYITRGTETCERCNHKAVELTEINYALTTDEEEEPIRRKYVCGDCEREMGKDRRVVMI